MAHSVPLTWQQWWLCLSVHFAISLAPPSAMSALPGFRGSAPYTLFAPAQGMASTVSVPSTFHSKCSVPHMLWVMVPVAKLIPTHACINKASAPIPTVVMVGRSNHKKSASVSDREYKLSE